MQEATYEMTGLAFDGQNMNQFKGDENLRVQFALYPHFNQGKSATEGRPIYDDEIYVTIMVPGQQDIVHRKAWRQDFERFPKQLAAFKTNQDQDAASGTPLRVLTWLTSSHVKELEFFNVRTVEQLANMPDSTIHKFMALAQLKSRAKDYLAEAAKQAPLLKMRTELEERDNKIEVLERQLKELSATVSSLQEKKSKAA